METSEKNNTWKLVTLPHLKEKKTIGCKWVHITKYRTDGIIRRYKIRLRFTQTENEQQRIEIFTKNWNNSLKNKNLHISVKIHYTCYMK